MDAKYDFLSVPSQNPEENAPILFPKIVSNGTVSFQELVRQMAKASGFNEGTIIGVQEEIEHWLLYYLSHGYRVKLGNIGTFEVTLKTDRPITDEKEIHAQSVHFDKVKMKVSRNFSKRCNGTLVRAPKAFKFAESETESTSEERFRLLESYLEKHPYITRAEYGELTGLLKTKAWKELTRWTKEGKLDVQGKAPHRVYVRLRKE